MATPARYRDAQQAAGFEAVTAMSRNLWYQTQARAALTVGQAFVNANIAI